MTVTVKLIGPLIYEGGFSEKALALTRPGLGRCRDML